MVKTVLELKPTNAKTADVIECLTASNAAAGLTLKSSPGLIENGRALKRPGASWASANFSFSRLLKKACQLAPFKETIVQAVLDIYDHALALTATASQPVAAELAKHYQKVVPLPFQPTCENLLLDIVERIQGSLPPTVELFEVKLFETATSSATWCAEDGKGLTRPFC